MAPTLSQEMASWLASGAAPLFADDGNAASLSEHSGEGSEASDNVPGGRPSPGLNLVVEEHSSGGVGAADVVDDVAGAVEDVDAGEKGGLKADVSPTVTPTSLLEAHAVEALREEGDGGRGPGDGTLRVENESGDELDAGREAGKEAGEKRGAVANEEGEGIDELATEEGERVGQDEAEESVALGVEGGRINDGVKSAEDGRADTDENVPLSSFNKSSREERGAFAVEPEVEEAEGHSTEVPKVASDLKPEERETTELGKKPELGLAKSGRAGVLEGSVEKQSAVKEEVQPEREPLSKSDILGEQTDGAAGVSQAAGDSSEQTADVARMVEETAKEPLEVAGDLAIMKTEREVEGSALEGHGRGAGNGKGGDENGMGGSPVTVTQEQPPEQALEEPEREESQGAEEGEESARAESPDIEARLEQWLRSKMVEREPEPESNPEPEPKPDLSPGPIAEPELDGLLRDESARQLDGEGGVLERKKGDVAEVGETGTEETNGGGREELGGNPVPVPPSLEVESGEASEKAEKDMEISRAEALGDGESVEGDGVEAGSLAEFPDEDRPAMATDREERPEVFEEPLAMSEEGLAVPGLPLAASMERPIAAEDRLIASEDRPIASEDRPIAPGERPIASEDLSTAAEGPPVLSEVVEEEERISGGQDLEPGALQMKNMDEIGARGGDSSLEGTALEEARGALEGEARRPEIEDVAARPEEVSARELASQAIGNKGVEDVNLGTGGAPGAVFEAEGAVEAAELISRPDRGSALLEAADVEVGNEAAIVAEEGAGANGDGVEDPVEADKGGGAQDGLSRLEGVGEGAVDVSGGLSPIELPVQEGNPPSELVSETRLLEESRTGAEETEAGPTEGLESEGTDGNAHTGSSLQAIELGHTRGAQDMEAGEAAVDPPQVSGGVDEGAPAPPTLRLVMEASPGDVYSHDGGAFLYTQKPDAFPSTELNSEASFPKRLFDTSPLPPGGLDLNADAVDDAMGPFDDVTADVMGVGKPVLDLNQEPQEAALLKEGGTLGGKVLAGGAVAAASDGGGNGDAESEGGVMYSAESAPSGAIDQSVVQKVGGCGIAAGVDGDGEGTSPVLGLREIEGEKEEMEAEVEQGRERFDEVNADGNPELAKEQAVGTAEEREGLLEDTAAQSGAEGGGGEVGLRKSNEGPPVTSTPEIGPVEGTTQGEDDREGERVMDRNDGAREGHVEGASNAGISEGPSEIQVPTRMGEKDEDGSGASPKSAESSGSKRKSEEAEVGVAKRAKKETDGGIAKKEALAPFDLNAPVADVSTEAGGDIADVSTEPGGGEVASGGATEGASEPWGVIDIRSVSEGATESEAKQAKGVAGAKGKALRGTALARAVKAQRAAERKAALEAEMQAGGEENEDGEKEEEVSETGGKSAGKQKGGASNTGPARAALAARLLSKAQRRAAAKERGGTPDSTVETPSPRNADVSTPLGSDATCGIDSDDPPSPPVEYDSPDDEPEFVPEGGSDQGPIQPPEPGVAPEGVTEQGATPPLEKGWEKKLKIETGEGEGSREVSPAGGGSAKSVRKGGSRTQPGGVMALCKEVVLSLSAHRAGHLFKDIDYEVRLRYSYVFTTLDIILPSAYSFLCGSSQSTRSC